MTNPSSPMVPRDHDYTVYAFRTPNHPAPTSLESICFLQITMATPAAVQKFHALLNRAMNIDYPDAPQEWRGIMNILDFGSPEGPAPAP